MNKLENKDICKKCGGYCCTKSGCDYWISDFEDLTYKGLLKKLSEGNISVVALLRFSEIRGKTCCTPFLYLRARNNNRDIIDLVSVKTKCSMLKENGCYYNFMERPGGGRNLIPGLNKNCVPEQDPLEKILEWDSYQKVLARIVKNYSGMSVEKKLREDVKNLIVKLIKKELDDALIEEKIDLQGMIPYLIKAFPQEALMAKEEVDKEKKKLYK